MFQVNLVSLHTVSNKQGRGNNTEINLNFPQHEIGRRFWSAIQTRQSTGQRIGMIQRETSWYQWVLETEPYRRHDWW